MSTKPSIDTLQELALQRGGKCLSTTYTNSATKLEWQCHQGHRWAALYHTIKYGHWCPDCSGKRKHTIEQMQEIAKAKGGKCLSTSYENTNSRLLWECAKGHQWYREPNGIINANSWCTKCVGLKRKTIKEIKELAISKGYKCLSTEYINSNAKLLWECSNGHQWYAVPHGNKISCPNCSRKAKPLIEDIRKIAKTKGGELLSTIYINNTVKLKWKCADGHIFDMNYASVNNSSQWCPQCNWFYNEEKCRFILEFLLQTEFKKTRQVLGNRLELDGYSEKHNLAFEYNGIQHFNKKKHFHSGRNSLEQTKKRDDLKENLCREKGIRVIYIPYFKAIHPEGLLGWIVSELNRLNISLIKRPEDVSYENFPKNLSKLKILQEVAKQNGGKLISIEYKGNNEKMEWECKYGHRWFASPNNVKNNESWCLKCSGSEKKTIEQMQEIAKSKGGKCLSKEYINLNTKLIWQCRKGHRFSTHPASVIHQNCWCPECSILKPLTLVEMHGLAKKKGGKCLSTEYINSETKLSWQCKEGHQWWATPHAIKHGNTWCLKCSGSEKKTIEQMHEIAKNRNGKCLSHKYTNGKTKLLWQCSDGHEWEAASRDILHSNSWCPTCARKKRTKARVVDI
jgi:hypothetical protein